MKRHLLETIAFLATLAAAPVGAKAPEVALLTDLLGRVEIKPEAAEWQPAALDAGLLLGDSVRTWDQSNAEIRFVDGTMLMLSERTRVRITTALFNPAEAPAPIRVALAAGAVDVRAARAPLEVQVEGAGHHRVEPGESAHIERLGDGGAVRLEVSPARLPVSTDFAPPDDGPGPERSPPDPAMEPAATPEETPTPAGPSQPVPEAPPPPFEEPMIEPVEEDPPPPRPRGCG